MQHTTLRNIYYLKYRIAVCVFVFLWIGLTSGLTIFSLILKPNQSIGIVELLGSILLGIMLIMLYQTRIVTSPVGISYYNSGLYSIHSTWENVESVSHIKFRLLGKHRCIILKEGRQLGWWTGVAFAVSKEDRGRMIPIPESQSWNKFEQLRKDIRAYAPSLQGINLIN